MDKKGVTEAMKARARRESECRHEDYIHPPARPGEASVKRCRCCHREILIKEK